MTFRTTPIPIVAVIATASLLGCPGPTAKRARPRAPTDRARAEAPRRTPPPRTRPRARRAAPPAYLSGAHILIAYQGANRAKASVTRTKRQALLLAAKLAGILDKAPQRFAELAKKHSDGPTAPRGGFLGAWKLGRMVPVFDNALRKIKIGQIAGPVASRFGYHVIKRLPLPPRYSARHILIAWKGAVRARASVTRTKAQALTLARKLAARLRKAPGQFAAAAVQYSDGPSGQRGGTLGSWFKGQMVPAFDKAVAKLAIGAIGGPVETRFGYHLLRREPLPRPPARRP